jgi:hypothetical protein
MALLALCGGLWVRRAHHSPQPSAELARHVGSSGGSKDPAVQPEPVVTARLQSQAWVDQRVAQWMAQASDHLPDEEHWYSDGAQALQEAKARNKLVFVASTHGDYFSGRL